MTQGHDDQRGLCPTGCGWLTDDPYGGPCSDCWSELHSDRPRPRAAHRHDELCDEEFVGSSWRPVVSVDPGRFL